MNSKFKTTYQGMGPVWEGFGTGDVKNNDIPTFKDIKQNYEGIKKIELELKKDLHKTRQELMTTMEPYYNNVHDDKDKRSLNRTDFNVRKFHMTEENYKKPEPALQHQNPLYITSNEVYGKLKPQANDIKEKWYPRNNRFTNANMNKLYRNEGLNTHLTTNRVNDLIDYL